MPKKVSALKSFIGLNIPTKNLEIIKAIIERTGSGSTTSIINEAITEWLTAKGYDPEASYDGRTDRWKRSEHSGSDTGSQ
jgi:hypothetical protein